jgi:hypothetical protein
MRRYPKSKYWGHMSSAEQSVGICLFAHRSNAIATRTRVILNVALALPSRACRVLLPTFSCPEAIPRYCLREGRTSQEPRWRSLMPTRADHLPYFYSPLLPVLKT